MSGIAHPSVPLRFRPSRVKLYVGIALALVATVAVALALRIGDSGGLSQSTATTSAQVGGPNEALRGQAAATAAGSPSISETGGPNEATRGQIAARASRP